MIFIDHIVGMGAGAVTNGPEDTLRTFALASCVAVTAYCPAQKAAGMIHVVLPQPLSAPDRLARPYYFAATGVPLLIETLCRRYGCRPEGLYIQMFGGADSPQQQDVFQVGQKNIDATRAALGALGLTVRRADLRGSESRTLAMEVKTGDVKVFRLPI